MKSTSNTKRATRPEPVAGELIPIDTVAELVFDGMPRKAFYSDILRQLGENQDSHVLRLTSTRPRAIVAATARKLGMKLGFAEKDGNLFCKVIGTHTVRPKHHNGTGGTNNQPATDFMSRGKTSLADTVRLVVRQSPRTQAEVIDHVCMLIPGADRASVSATLANLRNQNEIAKKDDLKWYPTGMSK